MTDAPRSAARKRLLVPLEITVVAALVFTRTIDAEIAKAQAK